MKKLIFLFLCFFLFNQIKVVFPLVDYIVNYDYITKNLCVNKSKPESSCHGKCYLIKELNKKLEFDQAKEIVFNFEWESLLLFRINEFASKTKILLEFKAKQNNLLRSSKIENTYYPPEVPPPLDCFI